MLDIAIIIVGYHTKQLIKDCLESLFRDNQNSNLNYKVLVVDNCSQDGTAEMLAREFPSVICLALPVNLGYPRAVNLGIRTLAAKYYLVLNPDVLFVQGQTLDQLARFMDKNTSAGLLGPRLLNPDGTTQMSCFHWPTLFMPFYRRTFFGRLPWAKKSIRHFIMADWDHADTRAVDWVLGTGMFIRRAAIEQAGLMDERFFMFYEDVDWCRRFWLSGWQIIYTPAIKIIHHHIRPSAGRHLLRDIFANKTTRVHIRSWFKYTLKYLFKLKTVNFYQTRVSAAVAENTTYNSLTMPNQITPESTPAPRVTPEISPKSQEDNSLTQPTHRRFNWLGLIGGLVLLALLIFVVWPVGRLSFHLWRGQLTAKTAITEMSALNFTAAATDWQAAARHWQGASSALDSLAYWRSLRLVKTDTYSAARNLLLMAGDLTTDIQKLNDWATTNIAPFTSSANSSVKDLDPQLKTNLLRALSQSDNWLLELESDLSLQQERLAAISASQANHRLITTANKINNILTPARDTIQGAREIIPLTISALGYPETKNYLFVLQNNGELRPSGGYLSTYGAFQIKNGEFVEFTTDNTDYLDLDGRRYLTEAAPAPLRRYAAKSRWLFSDANWSPDFPTTASKITNLYRQQSRDQRYFDGVVALDPTPIVELLAVTGPMDIDGQTFTAENFVDTMEYYTYEGFAAEGVSSRDRKDLIGQLGVQMIDYFLRSSLSTWQQVGDIVLRNLSQKHILFNFQDVALQKFITLKNWDGSIKNSARDYLLVIDANLNSRKTDRWTEKSITYEVSRNPDNAYIGRVALAYTNTATDITEKTRDLREYIRVYTPLGSRFISCELNGRSIKPDAVYQELGKTVIGNFITVKLGATQTLTCAYRLPTEIMSDENYELLVQKQPGTAGHPFKFKLNLDPQDPQTIIGNLTADQLYHLD